MATVFRANDLKHSRTVAVKVLRPELASAVGPDRFLREIRVLSKLTHPHIVPLLDSGTSDGTLYYVMPLIEGETLGAKLRREPQLTVKETLRLARELADGLAYAHGQGVVHRDIKPANILLSDGHALLADFGVAATVAGAGDDRLTETGLAIGSPMYMSPEQAAGGRVDGRSDLYSLGCVLYEMLTGSPPFTGPSSQAIMARHACDPVSPIHTVRSTVPAFVEATILQLLAKSPADRIQAATDLIEVLDHPPATRRWIRSPRRWVYALLGVAAAAGAVSTWLLRSGPQPKATRDWVIVANFVGPAGDSSLAPAVGELVTVELDQSPALSTMPQQQVASALRAAGFEESSTVTTEVARELAYRSSVRAVITGSVLPLGASGYSVVLRALDTEDGKEIASVAGPATPQDLIRSVQGLARQLRRQLGEHRGEIAATRSLEEIATPSFPAYRLFIQGRDRIYAGDFAGGNRLLHEAIGIDSAFASAWATLGSSYVFSRNLDSARQAYERALSYRDRLSEDQRFRVEADAAYALRHDLAAAISWYDLYLARHPESGTAHNNRALFLSSMGRHEEALEEFRRAVEVNPFGPEQAQIELLNQAAELIVLGRVREAQAAVGDLHGPFARYFALLLPTARSDWRSAEAIADSIDAIEGTPTFLRIQATTTAAAATAAQGAVTRARLLLLEAIRRSSDEEMRWYAQALLLLDLAGGRRAGPVPLPLARDSSAAGFIIRGLWAGVSGDIPEATLSLRRARSGAEEMALLGAGPLLVQGVIDRRTGRWQPIIDSLAPLALRGEHDATVMDRTPSFAVRWLVADAYAHLGRLDSAAAYLELLLAPTRMAPAHFALRGFAYPFAHQRLATWYTELGDTTLAQAHRKSLAETLTEPDPDLRDLLTGTPSGPARPARGSSEEAARDR
jgi:serine/threonine-protein kinase